LSFEPSAATSRFTTPTQRPIGHLAFQQHNEGSVVEYHNVMVKRLPNDEKAAWTQVKKDMPEISAAPRKSY
jgi:hypothetical protein